MRMGRLIAAAAWLLVLAAPARAETVVGGLSDTVVNIQSNFVGTELSLFGVIQRDQATVGRAHGYTVVVVVRGPAEDLVTRRKERTAGIWVNRDAVTYHDVPSYYAALSNEPIEDMSDAEIMQRLEIGLDNIDLEPEGEALPEDPEVFRLALLRRKQAASLYIENGYAVEMLTPTVFMTRIPLPAIIDTGGYSAFIHVFADDALVARKRLGFWVVKSGFEATVFDLAEDRPMLYGIGAVILAVAAGWLAGVIFRRD